MVVVVEADTEREFVEIPPRIVPLVDFRSSARVEAFPILGLTPLELRAPAAFGAIADGLPNPMPAFKTGFVFGADGKFGTFAGSSVGTFGNFFVMPTLGFRSVGFVAAGAGFVSFSFSFSFSGAFLPPPHTLRTIFMNPNLEVAGAALAPTALFLAPPMLPLA